MNDPIEKLRRTLALRFDAANREKYASNNRHSEHPSILQSRHFGSEQSPTPCTDVNIVLLELKGDISRTHGFEASLQACSSSYFRNLNSSKQGTNVDCATLYPIGACASSIFFFRHTTLEPGHSPTLQSEHTVLKHVEQPFSLESQMKIHAIASSRSGAINRNDAADSAAAARDETRADLVNRIANLL